MEHWVRIQGIDVDVERLRAIAHTCDPMLCRYTQCCCRSYDVTVDKHEIERVVGTVADAAELAPGLTEDGELIDPIDEAEGGFCLNTDEEGECVFAYRTDQGAIRCSMHSLALRWNLPPESVKPRACTLWPLAVHGKKPMQLSVQDDAYDFPCNTPQVGATLHEGIADIVVAIFGQPFLDELQAVLKNG